MTLHELVIETLKYTITTIDYHHMNRHMKMQQYKHNPTCVEPLIQFFISLYEPKI